MVKRTAGAVDIEKEMEGASNIPDEIRNNHKHGLELVEIKPRKKYKREKKDAVIVVHVPPSFKQLWKDYKNPHKVRLVKAFMAELLGVI